MENFIVYITTNLINGKQYVGSHLTNNINDNYLGSGRYFLKALRKEGRKNFKREILQKCNSILEARELEGPFIEKYNTLYPIGYNLSPRGGMGFNGSLSENHKKRLSEWQLGKTYEELYGVEKTKKIKEKQKLKKNRNRKHSEETKQKQREWQKGKTYEELYGPQKAAKMKEKQRQQKLGTTTKRKGKGFKQEFIEKYGEENGIIKYEEFRKKQSESHKK
jgi:hypothetical protein